MSEAFERTTVGDIVAMDFRAAAVFEQFGIDFCCGGRRSVAEACRTAAVNPLDVEAAIDALPAESAGDSDVGAWPLHDLIDHIVSTHHTYVRAALPLIRQYLAKLVEVHGARHPELADVASAFDAIADEMAHHMLKEEHVLFPYVRQLEAPAGTRGRRLSPFGTVENPIRMMEREHQDAADGVQAIRVLTHGYIAPEDGCTTYRVCMDELARFERDLHRHVHLENNVLFPRAIALEHDDANTEF
ncbi:MAG TPA: iron-sulfur cluster repair di-iron protein [Vicinamibacterales bacterium]|nr:iron-sulfur cluster repair di-iron protein [Vicinamibacterales bacterium]